MTCPGWGCLIVLHIIVQQLSDCVKMTEYSLQFQGTNSAIYTIRQ